MYSTMLVAVVWERHTIRPPILELAILKLCWYKHVLTSVDRVKIPLWTVYGY